MSKAISAWECADVCPGGSAGATVLVSVEERVYNGDNIDRVEEVRS